MEKLSDAASRQNLDLPESAAISAAFFKGAGETPTLPVGEPFRT